jgi:small-conductance mechanosensitive channel
MDALGNMLKDPILLKVFLSSLSLIFFLLVLFIIRRIVAGTKLTPKRKTSILKWTVFGLTVFFVLIGVRIWAGSGIFEYFQSDAVENVIKSGVALGLVYIILYFVRQFINGLNISISLRHQYRKRAGYIATLVYLLILIPIWAGSTQQWATVLSVIGAGIALALHEVLLNFAGWFYIMVRHPYRTGDRIELGSLKGDVIDIGALQTTLLEIGNWVDGDQSTGRVVHMPHGQIFRQPLYNYTQGFEFIWNELTILITFESNWESAKAILLKSGEEESKEAQETVRTRIDRMSREYLIYYKNFSPIVYVQIKDSGVQLTLRYLSEARKRRGGIHTISQKVLKEIAAAPDIEFAYPTYRIYRRGEEGEGSAITGK